MLVIINMSDTASTCTSTQLDLESCRSDSDDMDSEPYTVSSFAFSDHDTNVSSTVVFCGLRFCVDIFALNLQRSTKRLDECLHFLKVADAYEVDGMTIQESYD